MADNNKKKEEHGVNAVAAAGAGAVIGAGIAVAASAALNNPKTRKKIMSAFESVKDSAMEKGAHFMDSKNVKTAKKVVTKEAKKVEKKVEKKLIAGKKSPGKSKETAVVN